MAQRVKCFALYNSRKGWLGGALYESRQSAEASLREFLDAGPSVSSYDSVIELNGKIALIDAALGDKP